MCGLRSGAGVIQVDKGAPDRLYLCLFTIRTPPKSKSRVPRPKLNPTLLGQVQATDDYSTGFVDDARRVQNATSRHGSRMPAREEVVCLLPRRRSRRESVAALAISWPPHLSSRRYKLPKGPVGIDSVGITQSPGEVFKLRGSLWGCASGSDHPLLKQFLHPLQAARAAGERQHMERGKTPQKHCRGVITGRKLSCGFIGGR